MIEIHTTEVYENRGSENIRLPEWHTIENLLERMVKKKNMENDRSGGEYFMQKEMSEDLA